jgi:ubiquinone/menaquinone biosynthesis C-methylase UbiE
MIGVPITSFFGLLPTEEKRTPELSSRLTSVMTIPDYQDFLNEQERYYDELSADYAEWAKSFENRDAPESVRQKWRSDNEMVENAVRYNLVGSGPVLEVGCGLSRVPKDYDEGLVYLLDCSRKMLSKAMKSRDPRRFIPINARSCALPFKEETFSTILSIQLLSHQSDPLCRRSIKEMQRVLTHGGTLFISDSMAPFPSHAIREGDFQIRRLKNGSIYRVYKKYRSPKELISFIAHSKIEVSEGSQFFFNISCRKE